MKKINSGVGVLVAGAILTLGFSLAAANLGTIEGWDTRQGRFLQAVADNNLTGALVISIIAMVVGVVLIILGNIEKSKK